MLIQPHPERRLQCQFLVRTAGPKIIVNNGRAVTGLTDDTDTTRLTKIDQEGQVSRVDQRVLLRVLVKAFQQVLLATRV